ncbi:conserved hypothetical protein [Parvibaculum lavamentivorans DS-1]|uniref:DUF1640 domain-containing protein n=1 Tax=Parvibaculum lavamentivorans (strain DS-1 / DSM 13023 / NCIMB 13966) TaxID=402881 RepID=A7HXM0_PARL1|nr:hypothetical protein [Parvibaculum lavamentivorans]ABS64653.1 conserved hypothetical protein [Parvibaculum lavamentivorans DS-1]
MGLNFDTLTYSERLQSAGASKQLADEHAKLARDMVIADLVTKEDFRAGMNALKSELEATMARHGLRMTLLFGGMIAGAMTLLLAAIPLVV